MKVYVVIAHEWDYDESAAWVVGAVMRPPEMKSSHSVIPRPGSSWNVFHGQSAQMFGDGDRPVWAATFWRCVTGFNMTLSRWVQC